MEDLAAARLLRVAAAAIGFALLAGCSPPATAPAPPAATDGAAGATGAAGDLALPGCGKPPSPHPEPPPPGAVVPPGTVITAVREQAPLTQLNGYVTSTPVEIRRWVEAQHDLEVLMSEDEVFEAELLVTDGTWRTFVKARAVCDEGSMLAEVIAPEDSDAVIPTPAGSPAPP